MIERAAGNAGPAGAPRVVQRLEFRHAATGADIARLERLLGGALGALGWHPPAGAAVLNLACGRADETGALLRLLGPVGYHMGIDLRAECLAEAARRWDLPGGTLEWRCGDAAGLGRTGSLPAFDFIFIRHQNWWDGPAVWDRLLEGALAALAPAGLLACTSYFDGEHALLKAALATRGAELLWDAPHPASRPLPEVAGKSVDRHLAIFRRGGAGDQSPAAGNRRASHCSSSVGQISRSPLPWRP